VAFWRSGLFAITTVLRYCSLWFKGCSTWADPYCGPATEFYLEWMLANSLITL